MKDIIKIASREIGVKEVKGRGSNKRILQYAEEAGFKNVKADNEAWCSIFMNWCAHKAGLERSFSKGAKSWRHVGLPTSLPEPGDIVVFWRENPNSWKGHVGIFMGFNHNDRILCLGGNQGGQVSVSARSKEQLIGFRRLRPLHKVVLSNKILKRGSTGNEVRILQESLKNLGYLPGTSDGVFGSKTEAALKEFQSTNPDLKVSGVFDAETRKLLSGILNLLVLGENVLDKVFNE